MIYIEQKHNIKIPGMSALFVSFDYNAKIVNAIKGVAPVANYDKKTQTWELPVTSLADVITALSPFDTIDLTLMKDVKEKLLPVLPHPKYKTKPFEYQLQGIEYGMQHPKWLLLDAPGLGKTLQMLYLAQALKEQRGVQHCLIICGVNTLKVNWKQEILKHTKLSVRILGERTSSKGRTSIGGVSDRLADLNSKLKEFFIITNIETLRSNDIVKAINKGPNKFDMIVVDEVHRCKNPTSQQGKNFLKLTSATYRIALTGTLLLNNPLDAYVPMKWIGAESCTFSNFKYYYFNYGGSFHNEVIGYRYVSNLKDQLSSCSLRRTKDLLNLPPKMIQTETVEMNSTQQAFYNNVVDGIFDGIDKVNMDAVTTLSLVARLRQATECPMYLTTDEVVSEKVVRAVDLTEQIISGGEKVVIFATFKETLNVLMKALAGYNPRLCTGDIKDADIFKNVDDFQNQDSCKVLLCTTSKMGTGVTLTAANHAIFLSSPWTMADRQQCEDRIHRIGSDKTVFIHYLVCSGTIDEHVEELVADKGAVSDYIIDDKVSQSTITNLRKYIQDL